MDKKGKEGVGCGKMMQVAIKRTLLMLSNSVKVTAFSSLAPTPKLFNYATIRQNLIPSTTSIKAVEDAFGMLAHGLVDVPIPMHIGIHETKVRKQIIFPI